jgi:hypothetical protein
MILRLLVPVKSIFKGENRVEVKFQFYTAIEYNGRNESDSLFNDYYYQLKYYAKV